MKSYERSGARSPSRGFKRREFVVQGFSDSLDRKLGHEFPTRPMRGNLRAMNNL